MVIKPIYTLEINDGEDHISEKSEVKIKMENGNEYKGIFLNCDNGGLEVEIGEEESNILYLLYHAIENIEEI